MATSEGKALTQSGDVQSSYSKREIDDKLKDVNYIVLGVVIVVVIMVATLLIDSFHINSAIYKEYSEKDDSHQLIEENRKNQELIQQQQEQIIRLLSE